jgi:hypothetical protein
VGNPYDATTTAKKAGIVHFFGWWAAAKKVAEKRISRRLVQRPRTFPAFKNLGMNVVASPLFGIMIMSFFLAFITCKTWQKRRLLLFLLTLIVSLFSRFSS